MISEFDKRQLDIMDQKISQFLEGRMYLGCLIGDLDGLQNILEFNDDEWKQKFWNNWWDLEQIYAVGLSRNALETDVVETEMVYEAIDHLKTLVKQKLAQYDNKIIDIGESLKKELKKGYDIARISRWAFEYYSNIKSFDSPSEETIMALFSMGDEPRLEYTQEELHELADRLINGERDALKTVNKKSEKSN